MAVHIKNDLALTSRQCTKSIAKHYINLDLKYDDDGDDALCQISRTKSNFSLRMIDIV